MFALKAAGTQLITVCSTSTLLTQAAVCIEAIQSANLRVFPFPTLRLKSRILI